MKPSSTPNVWLKVSCPKCGAKAGQACKRMRYSKDVALLTPMVGAHRARVQKAKERHVK